MRSQAAFTRSDLLAAIVLLSLLAFLAAPAASVTRRVASTALCQSNMRTLVRAWQLYADDYSGTFVFNYHGNAAMGSAASNPLNSPWAAGWLDWATTPDNTNVLYLRSQRFSRLAPFLEEAEGNVHKCPADTYLSNAQRFRRFRERVRSVVMNGAIGDGNAPTGPWDPAYAQARRASELLFPGPERASVFLEEHPDSINDPFLFPPYRTSWIDLPAGLHGNASTFAFTDGYVEMHQWRQSARNQRVYYNFRPPNTRAGDADISWMSFHSNRRTEESY